FWVRFDPLEVLHANSAGKAALSSDGIRIVKFLEGVLRQRETSDAVVLSTGAGDQLLILVNSVEPVLAAQIARATLAWRLTPRQQEVVRLLAQGACNKDIALALRCSVKTVEKHVSATLSKAAADSRGTLVARLLGLK